MQVRARILVRINRSFSFLGGVFLLVNRKGELLWKCEEIIDHSAMKLIVLNSLERVHIYFPLVEKTSDKYLAPGCYLPFEEDDLNGYQS